MNYRIVIFDLDGTILNTLDDLADSTNFALSVHSLPQRTIEEVRHSVGNGIRLLIERAVPENTSVELTDAVFETFKLHYKDHCADKTRVYDGIDDLLMAIRTHGIFTAVVSNKADFAVQQLIKDYFPGLFDYAVGEREGIRRKPAPDSVQEVLRRFELQPEDAVYIGDSDVDIETARNAHMDEIAAVWGFREESFLLEHGAEKLAYSPMDVPKYLWTASSSSLRWF